jgi:phosphatidate phosphatase APP1
MPFFARYAKKACLRAERKKKSMKKEKRIFWVGQIGGGVVSDVDDKSGATDGGREYTLVTAVINGVRVTAFAGVGAALREMEGKSIKQMLLAYVENDGYFGFDLLAICDE